ncbi:MAG: RNA polymerase [Alphaproteobacteria bacterium]|nr:RNA polymerase [Alphaproteobacteria bacterium]
MKARRKDDAGPFDGLSAPARRALANAGIAGLAQLAKKSEAEISALHGMGPNAMKLLRAKLKAAGKAFAK